MDGLLAWRPPLLLASLVTRKIWSPDLYLKKLPCITVYILLQNSIKHPCSIRVWVPLSFSLSLSISLYFWLIPWSAKAGCVTQGILASFLLSLSHRRLRTTRFRSIIGPQHFMGLNSLSGVARMCPDHDKVMRWERNLQGSSSPRGDPVSPFSFCLTIVVLSTKSWKCNM